jgi:biotin synthase
MSEIRHDWQVEEILSMMGRPFNDLLFAAHTVHRAHFDPNAVQVSTLLSIKTGACPEDCGYCPQSAHHDVDLERERLLPLDEVMEAARNARLTRCQPLLHGCRLAQPHGQEPGAGGRDGGGRQVPGLETCMTLGMLTDPGRPAQGGRTRLLQPQPGHLAGVLRPGDHHPHLPGPAGDPGARA